MNWIKLTISIAAVLLGAALVVYGGYDDSPGGQLIGVLIVVAGIVSAFRSRKRTSGPEL